MEKVKRDSRNNFIVGTPNLIKSNIIFEEEASNNILYCEDGVKLKNSVIRFKGSNSLVFLSKSKRTFFLKATLYHDSTLYFGKNTFINGAGGSSIKIILSERAHIIIGQDCLFSSNIYFRTADAHLIYDTKTNRRLNHSKSIFLGDHVWIGQDAMILKGAEIGSGSIIGARSVVSGKKIHSNSAWGGNPVKLIRNNVQFTKHLVHNYDIELSNKREKLESNKYIYEYEPNKTLSFSEINSQLGDKLKSSKDRLYFLKALSEYDNIKNRFFI